MFCETANFRSGPTPAASRSSLEPAALTPLFHPAPSIRSEPARQHNQDFGTAGRAMWGWEVGAARTCRRLFVPRSDQSEPRATQSGVVFLPEIRARAVGLAMWIWVVRAS